MNAAVDMPWNELDRYTEAQRRFLRACAGRDSDPLIPFSGPMTTLRAAAWEAPGAAAESVRVAFVDAAGREHLEVLLDRGDLLALGVGPWIFQFASEEVLGDVLAAMLAPSLQRATRLLGDAVALRAQRVRGAQPPEDRPWPCFMAESMPHIGSLRLRISPALVEACEAAPMPRRSPDGLKHIPLHWAVRLSCVGLERRDYDGLAHGDVVRVLLSPLQDAELVGPLVPHGDAPSRPGVRPHRWVKVHIDSGGWITLTFDQDMQLEYEMDDRESLDRAIVPVNLTLPVAAMSLHEVDTAAPGTLVDTGVHLRDVEVALWTAGYRFASGKLVLIGDHLGVEIVRTERDLP